MRSARALRTNTVLSVWGADSICAPVKTFESSDLHAEPSLRSLHAGAGSRRDDARPRRGGGCGAVAEPAQRPLCLSRLRPPLSRALARRPRGGEAGEALDRGHKPERRAASSTGAKAATTALCAVSLSPMPARRQNSRRFHASTGSTQSSAAAASLCPAWWLGGSRRCLVPWGECGVSVRRWTTALPRFPVVWRIPSALRQ